MTTTNIDGDEALEDVVRPTPDGVLTLPDFKNSEYSDIRLHGMAETQSQSSSAPDFCTCNTEATAVVGLGDMELAVELSSAFTSSIRPDRIYSDGTPVILKLVANDVTDAGDPTPCSDAFDVSLKESDRSISEYSADLNMPKGSLGNGMPAWNTFHRGRGVLGVGSRLLVQFHE